MDGIFSDAIQWLTIFAVIGALVVAGLVYGFDWAWRKIRGIK